MPKRFAFFCALFLACVYPSARAATAPPELASLWDAAIRALQDQSSEEAARLLTEWIELGARHGIRSPEAHYNLGIAQWSSRKPGKAVYHLIESARLRSSPLSSLKAVHTLRSIEREIGIRDGVSQTLAFQAYFLLNRDWCLALSSLALWLAVVAIFLWWQRGRTARRAQIACLSIAGVLTVIAVSGTLNRSYFGKLAVLDGESDAVPLFREPNGSDEAKVVELPVGTIVTIGAGQADYTQVLQPVSGWVPDKALLAFTRE